VRKTTLLYTEILHIVKEKIALTIFIYSLPLAWKKSAGVLGGKNSLFLNFLLTYLKGINHV
jgi:hypothetical protein